MTFSSQYHLPVNYQMSGRAKIKMNQLRKCFFFKLKGTGFIKNKRNIQKKREIVLPVIANNFKRDNCYKF